MNKLIANVIERVAEENGYSPTQLLGHSRLAHLVRARHAAMFEARRLGFSYPELAKAFGRDHTSVMHACRKHERSLVA